MKLSSYRHFSDGELLTEADQYAHDPLIAELAKRLEKKIEETAQHVCAAYPDCPCDIND